MRWLLPHRRPLFPPVDQIIPNAHGLVGLGGDLAPDSVLEAYSKGIFPWDGSKPYPWFSPDPRLVLRPERFHASGSLRKLRRQGKVEVRYDTCFREVMLGCSESRRGQEGTWITPKMVSVYGQLHKLGIAHSVEAWEEGALVGGLYGLAVGRMFFGESMFARRRDASKLAFGDLCDRLARADYLAVDCQADTAHLRSLGAELIPRSAYLTLLQEGWHGPDRWADVIS